MIKPFLTRWSFLFKLRLFFAISALILGLVFVYLKIVPSGAISYERSWPGHWQLGKDSIYDFKPAERLDLSSQFLKIVADPVYFSLLTSRGFDQAIVKIKYREHLGTSTPVIALGVLNNKLTEAYDLQPIQNDLVDDLRFSWPRLVDSDSLLILQAEQSYTNPEDFWSDLEQDNLQNCPSGPTSCVALYNYSLPANYRLPDYAPLFPLEINQPLRGSHQFYLYLKKTAWRLSFDFIDLNQDRAADPVTVNILQGDKIIASQTINDDNLAPTSGKTEEKHLVMNGEAPQSGVYKVEVKIGSDMVIAKIVSSSNKLVFINRLWPVSGSGSVNLFTAGAYLGAQTANPASLGEIDISGKKFDLAKTNQSFLFPTGAGVSEIKLIKSDIVLENNSVFAFARENLFDPGFKKIDRYFSPVGSSIKYVIASYVRPLEDNGIKTAEAKFSLDGADRSDNKYTFLLSIPGLNGGADAKNYIEIEDLQISLSGKTWWQKIKSLF